MSKNLISMKYKIALRLCVGTWEGDVNSLAANILKGVAKLIVAFGNELKDDIFKEKISRYSIKELSRTAQERRAGSLGYAEAILFAYNKKMRMPLDIYKLYNKPSEKNLPEDFFEEDDDAEDENLKLNFHAFSN